jgi:carbon-monoxide dehydrogenase small subunit/xanthine dehydrogenase small subunit
MRFTLNGTSVDVDAHPMKRLLDVLREECELTGTKEGCGEGECGACTVLVDDVLVVSCLVPFAQVEGATVKTIEGLGNDHALQHHFMNEAGAQCGICTPGMIMVASTLPPDASLDEIRVALAGNLCRCTGYEAIYRAIQKAQEQSGRGVVPSAARDLLLDQPQ